jgi:predicted amidohydrolase
VALLQGKTRGHDQEANRRTGDALCRQAAAMGADIALFPEMWNIGYCYEAADAEGRSGGQACPAPACDDIWRAPELWGHTDAYVDPFERRRAALDAWRARAVDRDGAFVSHFAGLAGELGMAIAITYLERWPGGPRNTVSLFDRRGVPALTYAKVHTCDFDLPEAMLTPGDGFPVCQIETAAGPVKLGAMICFDREFPESARALMLGGAEVILVPNACDMDEFRIAQTRVRACENLAGIAVANYPSPRCNGHSVAFHPMVYDERGAARDNRVVEAGEAEGVYLARFDLDDLRRYRTREAWGNAFRRPHRYGRLTDETVEAPFVRVNAQNERWDQTRRFAE